MNKLPELLKHNAILSHWSSYPEGSIKRAKSIGIELLATYERLEVTEELWESELDIVVKEQAWKPLGLKSREEFVKAVTGRTEDAVRKTLRRVGRPKAGEENGDNVTICGKGNGPSYLAARLRRSHPNAIFDESVRGSVRKAAIAAGIVKAPSVLAVLMKAWGKATAEERAAFEQWQSSTASTPEAR